MTNELSDVVVPYEAVNTTCASSCTHLWLLMLLIFCNMFATFLCTMPALSATLRVVREDEKSFALGIQWMKVRILGTVPAPMIFGTLIDKSCMLWHDIDNDTGACLVYDNLHMSRWRSNAPKSILFVYHVALLFSVGICSVWRWSVKQFPCCSSSSLGGCISHPTINWTMKMSILKQEGALITIRSIIPELQTHRPYQWWSNPNNHFYKCISYTDTNMW